TASGNLSLAASLGNVTSYTDTGLANNTTFFYKVSAVSVLGEGAPSSQTSATTFGPPQAPANLAAATGPGVAELSLTWTAASSAGTPVTGYRVYRGTSNSSLALVAELGNVTAHTDEGLAHNTTYFYKVSAVSVLGEGARSNEASATTFGPPGAPQGLAASAGPGVGELTLSWTAATSLGTPVTGYKVYRGTTSGSLSFVADLGNVTTYTDSGLEDDTTYYYEVTAVSIPGEGPRSNEASARTFAPPGPPEDLAAVPALNLRDVVLQWDPPASNGGTPVTGYRVYRAPTIGSGGYVLVGTVGAVTTFTDREVPLGLWNYRVAAVNAVGEGPLSDAATSVGLLGGLLLAAPGAS
ncbi:MAG TPA: fibronectin type III domain-containing protein, partial [Candidatus Thermoplasmatota archaeon]|nr:fibronectin type III domain-containing protein [Candidatus Thermoplasmatota archaeon]